MVRYVWDLVAIVVVLGVGNVYSALPSVLQAQGDVHIAARGNGGGGADVDTADVHKSQIEHRPTELLSLGVGHNLIVYLVVISVGTEFDGR